MRTLIGRSLNAGRFGFPVKASAVSGTTLPPPPVTLSRNGQFSLVFFHRFLLVFENPTKNQHPLVEAQSLLRRCVCRLAPNAPLQY